MNDPPVGNIDSMTVTEGGTVTVLDTAALSILDNDTDAEGDPLAAVLVNNVTNGTLTLNPNGTFSYTLDGGQTTSDIFTYRASDGSALSTTVIVAISITATNDAPVAVADAITIAEGGTATVLDSAATTVLANDTDAEGDILSAILVTGVTNGVLTLNGNGTFL